MNIKTRIEKTIFMDLRMEEEEARQLARDIKSGKWGSCKILNKLLCAIPVMEGESDEKITDDDLDLNFDDLCFKFDGPDVPVGPAADGADTGGAGSASAEFPRDIEIMERRSAINDATLGIPPEVPTATSSKFADAADPQNKVGADLPADVFNTYATDCTSSPGDVCSCGCKGAVAEDFDIAAQRSAKSEWDKPRRSIWNSTD